MSESLIEKIKQAFEQIEPDTESLIYLTFLYPLKMQVFKILSDYYLIGKDCFSIEQIRGVFESWDYIIIDKEKLRELVDLLKNRPKNIEIWNAANPIKLAEKLRECGEYFEKLDKKFVEAFNVESVKPTKNQLLKALHYDAKKCGLVLRKSIKKETKK